jgi:hypothetical protein
MKLKYFSTYLCFIFLVKLLTYDTKTDVVNIAISQRIDLDSTLLN